MPLKPQTKTLVASSADILNVIRNGATQNYKDYIPEVEPNSDSIREIGAIIMGLPSLQNEFLSSLINRIGKVIITSKTWNNPLNVLKKGFLEMGETIEEIFVNIAKVQDFDETRSESEVFKREHPDVRTAFHVMNYQKFYKVTTSRAQLKQAFLSWDGVVDLINRIIETLYTAMNYDEFLVTKYMLARQILDGKIYVDVVGNVSESTLKTVVSKIKAVSNNLTFLKSNYNIAGVKTSSQKHEQVLLVNSVFDAVVDVELLATAFNMSKADFESRKIVLDSFGELDNERLKELFSEDATYREITVDEQKILATIPAMLIDENFIQIFDNELTFDEMKNGQGLYWNNWLHSWKTFSTSPFSNAILFGVNEPIVETVSITPDTATLPVGGKLQLTVDVLTSNFAPMSVIWSSDNDNVFVSSSGFVEVLDGATGTATITATSTFDDSKVGTCVVTIA